MTRSSPSPSPAVEQGRGSTASPHRSWLAVALPLVPALLACFKVLTRDIGFHVATGRAIDALGRVPATNVLSFTHPDQAWVLHQWIPAYLYHRIDHAFGPAGLVIAKVIMVYVTFLLLWLALRRSGASLPVALLWFSIAACAAFPRFLVRPYLFSMLCLALLLWTVTAFRAAVWTRASGRTALVVSILAVVGCSALHAGFVYLWIVVLSYSLALAIDVLIPPVGAQPLWRSPSARQRVLTHLAWLLALAGLSVALVELVNPFGIQALLLPFRFSSDPYLHAHLVEYRPPPFDFGLYPALWVGLLLAWVSALLSIGWTLARRQRLTTTTVAGLVALAAYSYLVLKHTRVVYAFALVAAFFAAQWTEELLGRLAGRTRHLLCWGFATIALLLTVVTFGLWHESVQPGLGRDSRLYPQGLLSFVEEQQLPQRAYVSDAWGGDWLWRFYPRRRVFFDNRLEAYPPRFVREVYQSIRYGEPGWQDKLDQYGVRLAVLRYTTAGERRFLKGRPSIRQRMLSSAAWRLVYWDDQGMIFVRRAAALGRCTRCGDYRRFDPDEMRGQGAHPAATLAELEQVLRVSGPSARVYAASSDVARAAGNRQAARAWLSRGLQAFPQAPLLLRRAAALR